MDKKARMKELCDILNEAAKVYYQGEDEIMSNFEYDKLYDELLKLEEETSMVLSGSPTHKVGFEVVSELPKFTHPSKMLSLDKTKSVDELSSFLGNKEGLLSWKLDGLTVVLTYNEGSLVRAVTRGNGIEGEVITANAKTFVNIPLTIPYSGELTVRGEAVISYSDFKDINNKLDEEEKYKNPRNLCSGSVRQLNSAITAKRNVRFFAFTLVSAEDVDFKNSNEEKYIYLKKLGFEVVDYKRVDSKSVYDAVKKYSEDIKTYDIPSDGLVLLLDDISYGESLGMTAKFPKNAIAFKWQDETAVTTLINVEWNASRTGLINPVAVFEPVELEGTSVSRASVHNVSVVKDLKLGIGDKISVYKANMIIPQIAENMTMSDNLIIPDRCPVCGEPTVIKTENASSVLMCENKDCTAKKINGFIHFVERDAMNIDGLSKATLEKFIACGFIHEPADLYKLDRFKDKIVALEGFGKRAYEKLDKAIVKSKTAELPRFIFGLGIANVGLSTARLICDNYNNDFNRVKAATKEELVAIDGIGEVIAKSFEEYFQDEKNMAIVNDLLEVVEIEVKDDSVEKDLDGLTFVITGSLNNFSNRSELKDLIVNRGGKVAGSVSKNTAYLINNDVESQSSKNKKARELGISIISEEDFLEKFGK
ncbi:MAG: NAD-dependent DNA ligase LigA [Lachnospiraceae bacterium]|nr:NAD-dependent DNA ligase LigA [Lachnospiraceae bacterium]